MQGVEADQVYHLLLCRVIVSTDPHSQAAHWLKNSQDGKKKAAKVQSPYHIYPEYLMLCKLVKRVSQDQPFYKSNPLKILQ